MRSSNVGKRSVVKNTASAQKRGKATKINRGKEHVVIGAATLKDVLGFDPRKGEKRQELELLEEVPSEAERLAAIKRAQRDMKGKIVAFAGVDAAQKLLLNEEQVRATGG